MFVAVVFYVLLLAIGAGAIRYGWQIPGTVFNWTGKLGELAVALLALGTLKIDGQEAGLVRPRADRSVLLVALLPALTLLGRYGLGTVSRTGTEAILFQLLAAPLAEEIGYRGVLQGLLRRCGSPKVAVVVGALLFAGVHMVVWRGNSPSVDVTQGDILLWGLVLGTVRERTGSIWPGVAAHAAADVVTAW